MELELTTLGFDMLTLKTASGETVTYNLKDELMINTHNLLEEFNLQPAKYVYWSSLLETVRAYLEASQLKEEQIRASLYEACRIILVDNGTAKPTKDQIEAEILKNDTYIEARELVNTYSYFVKNLQYTVKAFEQRKDMLLQLGAESRRQKDYEAALKDYNNQN